MQINTDIWGAQSTWLVDLALSDTAYTNEDMLIYNGKHHDIDSYTEFLINKPIDYSICYCGQAVGAGLPLTDIAAIDYMGNVVATQTNSTGWFLATNNTVSTSYKLTTMINNAAGVAAGNTEQITRSEVTRWYPSAAKYNENYYGNNVNKPICPVVSFPLKSMYGSILVGLYHKTDKSYYSTMWLHDLETNINTYKDDYVICKAFLTLYCYSGGGESSYTDFSRKDVIAAGAGFTEPLMSGSTGILSYTWACNSGWCNLPLFGDCNIGDTLNNIKGVRVFPYDWEHYGDLRGNNCAAIIYNYGLVTDQSIEQTTDQYGYDAYMLRIGMDITEDSIESLRKAAAGYGIFFSDYDPDALKHDVTNSTRWTNSKMCLAVLDTDGVSHGEYTRGTDNANNPVYNIDRSNDNNFDPSKNIDPNVYSNITGFNSISAGASATERYVLDAGNTRQLLSDLWSISHDIAGVDYEKYDYKILDSFLVTNPIDCIISLKRFPFSIPHTFSVAKTPVNLGKNHGSAEGYLTYNVFNTVQFAGIDISPRFGNSFLDYAPYTEYELYVPFCGTVKLNAGDILGHTLNCRLQIDLITGACTAYIMADSLVIETMTGTVSCELALTGIDSATIDANIQNSVLNHVNARTNKEVSMLSPLSVGGLVGAVSNPFKTAGNITTAKTEMQRAEYELTHIQTQPHTMGTAGGLTGWYQEFNARLMIYYPEGDVITSAQPPKLKNLTSYGHTTGFATINNATLSNYSGFTVATNAILDFAATTTEKDLIESALNGGIFI